MFDPLDQEKHDWIRTVMGAFDKPTRIRLGHHIFVAVKGDNDEITNGLPHNEY